MTLHPDPRWSSSDPATGEKVFAVGHASIYVPHLTDMSLIPPEDYNEEGRRTWIEFQLIEQVNENIEIGVHVINRFTEYFRYRQGQTKTRPMSFLEVAHNAEVVDSAGTMIARFYTMRAEVPHSAITRDARGLKSLKVQDRSALEAYIGSTDSPALHEYFYTQAREELDTGNSIAAVMHLAISIEVATKQRLTSLLGATHQNTIANKKPFTDLLSTFPRRLFGKDLETQKPLIFRRIVGLFRARNKIAHVGELFYNDDAGNRRVPDQKELRYWLQAGRTTFEWLRRLR